MKNTFELEHVGINTDNAGEAEQLALLLCKLFNLDCKNSGRPATPGAFARPSARLVRRPSSR